MDIHAWIAIATLVVAMALFISKKIPLAATALSIPVVLAVTGTVAPAEAAQRAVLQIPQFQVEGAAHGQSVPPDHGDLSEHAGAVGYLEPHVPLRGNTAEIGQRSPGESDSRSDERSGKRESVGWRWWEAWRPTGFCAAAPRRPGRRGTSSR